MTITVNTRDKMVSVNKCGSISVMLISTLLLCQVSVLVFCGGEASRSKQEDSLCGVSWHGFQDSCYKVDHEKKTWEDARNTCISLKSDLVIILSAEEQQFVYGTFGVKKSIWIGLRRNTKGVFGWVSGHPLVYQNWISHPGNDTNNKEQCGEMTDYGQYRGMWNDLPCGELLPFICERVLTTGQIYRILPRKRLSGHCIQRIRTSSDAECLMRCQRMDGCRSVNFRKTAAGSAFSQGQCELNNALAKETSESPGTDNNWSHYVKIA